MIKPSVSSVLLEIIQGLILERIFRDISPMGKTSATQFYERTHIGMRPICEHFERSFSCSMFLSKACMYVYGRETS